MLHAKLAEKSCAPDTLFDRIGAFLAAHRLSADPAHYSFVYTVLSEPDGVIAKAVAQLVDGGVRLHPDDIARLGGQVSTTREPAVPPRQPPLPLDTQSDQLVAQTQAQVQGFAETVRAMQDATRGFGEDLAQSAAAMDNAAPGAGMGEIARITGTMIHRIHATEVRLAEATAETDVLRVKLAEARDTARRDPLTGLANRLAFEEAFARCGETQGPCCLAVLDVDRFKRVNDEHGHAVGDRVLVAIGQALAEECGGHLVTRHGGEEFAILFGGITLADATDLLETARGVVGTKHFRNRQTGKSLGRITVSAGITQVGARDDNETAFARADRLLYDAKAMGRDRVCAG